MPGRSCAKCLVYGDRIGVDEQGDYLEWFKKLILLARPVLLVQDGHSSHVSVDQIELAQANDIYLLCLPAHTTHILQPLDVGVFKSFKAFFLSYVSIL